MSVAPRKESSLFSNRDKFDLIAIYDDSSKSFGDAHSPLQRLTHAIYEKEFRKIPRNIPVLLVGGLDAWRKDVGEQYVIRGEPSGQELRPHVPEKSAPIDIPSPVPSTSMHTHPIDPHQLWTPKRTPEVDSSPYSSKQDISRYSLDYRPPLASRSVFISVLILASITCHQAGQLGFTSDVSAGTSCTSYRNDADPWRINIFPCVRAAPTTSFRQRKCYISSSFPARLTSFYRSL